MLGAARSLVIPTMGFVRSSMNEKRTIVRPPGLWLDLRTALIYHKYDET